MYKSVTDKFSETEGFYSLPLQGEKNHSRMRKFEMRNLQLAGLQKKEIML